MSTLGILLRITQDSSQARSDTRSFNAEQGAQVDALTKKFASANNVLYSAAQKLAIAGATISAAITVPLIGVGSSIVQAATEMDSLRRGLLAVEGDAAKVEARLKTLNEVAKLPGLGLKEAIQGQINLEAAGIEADLATRSLKAFGNALATVGKGKYELELVQNQLTQIASKGKIAGEDLRSLSNTVPQLRAKLKEAFGTASAEEINKLGLSADEFLRRLLPKLEELPQVTGGARNAFENFEDTLFKLKVTLGNALLPTVVQLLSHLESAVTQLDNYFKTLSEANQQLILILAGVAAAIGPVLIALSAIVGAISSLAGYIASASAAVGGFGALFATLGYALLGLPTILFNFLPPIAAVVAALYAFYLAFQQNVGGIQNFVVNAFTIIKNAVFIALDYTKEVWQRHSSSIIQIATTLWNGVKNIVFSIVGAITPFVVEKFNFIVTWVQDNWPLIRRTVETVLTAVLNVVFGILDKIKVFWSEHGETVIAIVNLAWTILKTYITTAIQLIAGIIKFVMQVINGEWSGAWETFKSTVVILPKAVGTIFLALLDTLKTIFVDIVTTCLRLGQDIVTSIIDGILGNNATFRIISAITAVLTPGLNRAESLAQQKGAQAGNAFVNAFESAVSGANLGQGQRFTETTQASGTQTVFATDEGSSVNINSRQQKQSGGSKPSGGGGGGGGKKDNTAQREADEASRARLREASVILSIAERQYKEELAKTEALYKRKRETLDEYVEAAKATEDRRLNAVIANIQAERNEVDSTEKGEEARRIKRRELDEREAAAKSDSESRKRQIDEKAADEEAANKERQRQHLLRLGEIYDEREIASIKEAHDARIYTAETTEQLIADVETRAYERRREQLLLEREDFQKNSEEYWRITEELKELDASRANQVEETTRKINAARRTETEELKRVLDEERRLRGDNEQHRIDIDKEDLERLKRNGVQRQYLRDEEKRLEVAQLELDRRLALETLNNDKDAALKRLEGLENEEARKAEIKGLYRERELLSIEEFERRKFEIEERYKREEDSEGFLGSLEEEVGKIGDTLPIMEGLGQAVGQVFNGMRDAVGSAIEAYVLYGKLTPAILRKALAEQLALIAKQAAIEAIKQVALGLAALAIYNFDAAGKHFASAAAWGALAVGAAAAGRLVAGNLFNQQKGSGSDSASGSNASSSTRVTTQKEAPVPIVINDNGGERVIRLQLEVPYGFTAQQIATAINNNHPLNDVIVELIEKH